MRKVQELKASQVYRVCDLGSLNVDSTDDLKPCEDFIGQKSTTSRTPTNPRP